MAKQTEIPAAPDDSPLRGEEDPPGAPKTIAVDGVETPIDGFSVREVILAPPSGAPYGPVRLVLRRATNALNLRIDQTANRLLAHMAQAGRDVDHAALRRYANNFVACAAQTLLAEGVPGLDWAQVKVGMESARLLAAFDRWLALDGALCNQWVSAVAAVDAPPRIVDPNSPPPPSAPG